MSKNLSVCLGLYESIVTASHIQTNLHLSYSQFYQLQTLGEQDTKAGKYSDSQPVRSCSHGSKPATDERRTKPDNVNSILS